PGPTAAASANSSNATVERCFSMRSAICPCRCKRRSCGLCRSRPSSEWGETRRYAPTWLIAASHRDLKLLSAKEIFRPDLYYRLGVFTIHLPPLRERGDDLPLLVERYLRRYSKQLGRDVRELPSETLDRLR